MKLSVVLIWLCLSSVQLQRPDDRRAVGNGVRSDVQTGLKELRNMVVKLKQQLQSSQGQIEELKKESAETGKVAFLFASGLNGYYGPFSSEITLVFRKQITNIGDAFNPLTGFFTAPVKGVYYFRFSVLGNSKKYWAGVTLMKNHESVIVTSESPTGHHQYAVGGVTLQLESGDTVYVKLRSNCQIYDSDDNHTSFSGFLIFPL